MAFDFIKKLYKIQSTFIDLRPNEYTQGLRCYPFLVKLERCVGSWNTFNDLSIKVCVPNRTGCLNLSVFNMVTVITESKTLTKHISWKCKCDVRKCNSNQK